MSTSSVSLSPNPSTASFRRPLTKKSTPDVDPLFSTPPSNADLSNPLQISTQHPQHQQQTALPKMPLPNHPPQTNPLPPIRRVKKTVKPPKPKWVTVTRILTKNLILLLVIAGLVQFVRRFYEKKAVGGTGSDGDLIVISADLEGKFAEMDSFIKKTSQMIQLQVDVIDKKLEKHVSSLNEDLERRDAWFDSKLNEIRINLEKELGGKLEGLLSKEEFEEFVKGRSETGGVSLDEVRVYAKEVVEKEIERHGADGLGRVDYALWSGGARVLRHSEVYGRRGGGGGLGLMMGRSGVNSEAEKMFSPSFGEPGKCFAMKGSSGFVVIRLRTGIVPDSFTLEHVAKSVAYDRSSAPKDCRVSGWYAQAEDLTGLADENEKMFLLSEFTYDLEKNNVQTFQVLDSVGSSIVNTIRFDFTSNHGSDSHTCIYRLRVHGHEPTNLPMLTTSEP